jgi:hypothetical protein
MKIVMRYCKEERTGRLESKVNDRLVVVGQQNCRMRRNRRLRKKPLKEVKLEGIAK